MTYFVGFILLFSSFSWGKDLTLKYERAYENLKKLSVEDINQLRQYEIILIPGVLSEVLIEEDRTVPLDFSKLTQDYFGHQLQLLQDLKLKVLRLPSSTASIGITKKNLKEQMDRLKKENKKGIFMTHSLGGLILMDYLIEGYPQALNEVGGVLFLQSPFYGAPVANVYLSNPYFFRNFAKPILPLVNFSEETIEYLAIENRVSYMQMNAPIIFQILEQIPSITMSGISNGYRSLFTPAAEVMHHGCIGKTERFCLTKKLFNGPYDLSDGMVPLKSSKLPGVDSIQLHQVDHGELVVGLPFTDFDRSRMTISLIKILLEKISDKK